MEIGRKANKHKTKMRWHSKIKEKAKKQTYQKNIKGAKKNIKGAKKNIKGAKKIMFNKVVKHLDRDLPLQASKNLTCESKVEVNCDEDEQLGEEEESSEDQESSEVQALSDQEEVTVNHETSAEVELKLSDEQEAVINHECFSTTGSSTLLAVSAAAGTGKSTMLKALVKRLPSDRPLQALAFNRSIVNDLQSEFHGFENLTVSSINHFVNRLHKETFERANEHFVENLAELPEVQIVRIMGAIVKRAPPNMFCCINSKNMEDLVHLFKLGVRAMNLFCNSVMLKAVQEMNSREDIVELLQTAHHMSAFRQIPFEQVRVLMLHVAQELYDESTTCQLPLCHSIALKQLEVELWTRIESGTPLPIAVRHCFNVALDEAQDALEGVVSILIAMLSIQDGRSRTLVLIGDARQTLYAYRLASSLDNVMEKLDKEHVKNITVSNLELTKVYRSSEKLCVIANCIIGLLRCVGDATKFSFVKTGIEDCGTSIVTPQAMKDSDEGYIYLSRKNATLHKMFTSFLGKFQDLLSAGKKVDVPFLQFVNTEEQVKRQAQTLQHCASVCHLYKILSAESDTELESLHSALESPLKRLLSDFKMQPDVRECFNSLPDLESIRKLSSRPHILGSLKSDIRSSFRKYQSWNMKYVLEQAVMQCLLVGLAREHMTSLVVQLGPSSLVHAKEQRVLLSTVHAAKGQEHRNVTLADDFTPLFNVNGTLKRTKNLVLELYTYYVAVTRATKVLALPNDIWNIVLSIQNGRYPVDLPSEDVAILATLERQTSLHKEKILKRSFDEYESTSESLSSSQSLGE